MHTFRILACLAAFALFAPTLAGQTQLYTLTGDGPDDGYGTDVAGGRDLNGDGLDDFVVGIPEDNTAPVVIKAGAVRAIAGDTGTTLWTAFGIQALSDFGWSVDLGGDLNGDGVPDVIVGTPKFDESFTPDSGIVQALSGSDGQLLWTSFGIDNPNDHFGWDVASMGDISGDGIDDIVAGSLADYALVLSGADGTTLRTELGQAGSLYGKSVSSAGDANNDGIDDYIIGAPNHNGTQGATEIISGANGAQLHFDVGLAGAHLGSRVCNIGDINGDGHDDQVAAAPGVPIVRIDSGKDVGQTLLVIFGPSTDRWAEDISAVGDMDGDGLPDLAIGWSHDPASASFGGSFTVHSSATGLIVFIVNDSVFGEHLGHSLDGAGDLNGDGIADLIVGREQEFAEAKPGAVRTYTTCVGTAQNYGSGLAGSDGFVPEISFAGCAELGGSVTLTIDKLLGGTPGILFVGLAPAALPAKGGSLLVQILFAINHQASGPAGVAGAGSVTFPATLPNDPLLIGQTIYQQAWYADSAAPANISMTDGLGYTVVGF